MPPSFLPVPTVSLAEPKTHPPSRCNTAAPSQALHMQPEHSPQCSEVCMAARSPSDARSLCPASAGHIGLPIHPGTAVPLQGRSFPNRCKAGSRTLAHPWAVQNGSCWSPEGCTNRPPNTVGVGGRYGTGAVTRADRGVWGYRLLFGRMRAQGSRAAKAVVSGAGARASLKRTWGAARVTPVLGRVD